MASQSPYDPYVPSSAGGSGRNPFGEEQSHPQNASGNQGRNPFEDEQPYVPGGNAGQRDYDDHQPYAGQSAGGQGNSGFGQPLQDTKLRETQEGINRAMDTMGKTINNLQDRGGRLDDLTYKTDNLARGSDKFAGRARDARKREWWKLQKTRMWVLVGIIVLLIVIIVPSVVAGKH